MCLQYLFLLFFEDKILSSLQFRWSESKSDNFPNSWKLHASAVTLAGMCRTDSELFFPQNYHWSWVSSPKTVLFTHQSSTAHQSLSQGLGCSVTAVHQTHLRMWKRKIQEMLQMRCWAGRQEAWVPLQQSQIPARWGGEALPTPLCSPSTLPFICLEREASRESSRRAQGRSTKQLHSHTRLVVKYREV